MGTRGVCVVVGILGLALHAQPTTAGSLSLNKSAPEFSALELASAQYFFFATGLNWIEPVPANFLSPLPLPPSSSGVARSDPSKDGKDSSKETVDLARKDWIDYVHGEVGFLYGRSTGKFGGELEQGYVIGTVGNDKFSITAGASVENWSGRVPKFGR